MSRNVIHEIATASLDADAATATYLLTATLTASLAYGAPDTMPESTLSVPVTSTDDRVLVAFSGGLGITGGAGYVYIDLLVDAAPVAYNYFYFPSSVDETQEFHFLLTGLSVTTHEIKPEWYTDPGRTAWAYLGRQFSAMVIKR